MSAIDEASPVVSKLLIALAEGGFILEGVDDGDGKPVWVDGYREAMEMIFATDSAVLCLFSKGKRYFVLLIPSNGVDVISDHTDAPELDAVMDLVLAPDDAFYIAGAIDRIEYWGLIDEIEVDDARSPDQVSRCESGAFVKAWIWVPND